MWLRHRAQRHDANVKIRRRLAAIYALPTPELRQEALTVTDLYFPMHSRLATRTPPSSGFHRDDMLELRGDESAKAGRLARFFEEEEEVKRAARGATPADTPSQ